MYLCSKKHKWVKTLAHTTERKDTKRQARGATQKDVTRLRLRILGRQRILNEWQALYLGTLFQPDGRRSVPEYPSKTSDDKISFRLTTTCVRICATSGQIRIYITTCCSILVYGYEASLAVERKSLQNNQRHYMNI